VLVNPAEKRDALVERNGERLKVDANAVRAKEPVSAEQDVEVGTLRVDLQKVVAVGEFREYRVQRGGVQCFGARDRRSLYPRFGKSAISAQSQLVVALTNVVKVRRVQGVAVARSLLDVERSLFGCTPKRGRNGRNVALNARLREGLESEDASDEMRVVPPRLGQHTIGANVDQADDSTASLVDHVSLQQPRSQRPGARRAPHATGCSRLLAAHTSSRPAKKMATATSSARITFDDRLVGLLGGGNTAVGSHRKPKVVNGGLRIETPARS